MGVVGEVRSTDSESESHLPTALDNMKLMDARVSSPVKGQDESSTYFLGLRAGWGCAHQNFMQVPGTEEAPHIWSSLLATSFIYLLFLAVPSLRSKGKVPKPWMN